MAVCINNRLLLDSVFSSVKCIYHVILDILEQIVLSVLSDLINFQQMTFCRSFYNVGSESLCIEKT